jgi:hypothetical protein
MAGHWTDQYSFITASILRPTQVVVSLANDELAEQKVPYTYYTAFESGAWKDGGDCSWDVVASGVCDVPLRQVIAVGPHGQVCLLGSKDRHEEDIASCGVDPKKLGLIRDVRGISGKAYVCGMNRQVYRRDGSGQWAYLSSDIPRQQEVVGFEAIDGFSEKEIYAVGWKGEIWSYDGTGWTKRDSPTNRIFSDVCCAGDGFVYACGGHSTLVKGRGDQWAVIDLSSVTVDLWSLEWFAGKLYLASTRDVFSLTDNGLVPIDFGTDAPGSCRYLDAGDEVMWSIGAKDIFSYDGNIWTRID